METSRPPSPTIESVSTNVATNVRNQRQERGWSLAELSQHLEQLGHPLSVTVLSKMELGDRRIGADDLVALAKAFGMSMDALVVDPTAATRDYLLGLIADARQGVHRHEIATTLLSRQLERIADELAEAAQGSADAEAALRDMFGDRWPDDGEDRDQIIRALRGED